MFAAITAVGTDRPGIVSAVTGTLFRLGCNLEETTMTRLRDQFAMLLLVRLPDGRTEDDLRAAMADTARDLGLSMVVRALGPETPAAPAPGESAYILRLYGADQPGIVHRVTTLLAERRLNITDLNTRVIPGAAGPVYVLLLELDAPPGAVGPELEAALEALHRDLGVEITLEALEREAL